MVSPTLPFPSPPPFHSPKFSDKPVGGKVRSSDGEVPRLPPYKYHPATGPRKKFDNIFSRLDTMHERDEQTDRQTDTERPQSPRLRIASRGKNGCNYGTTSLRCGFVAICAHHRTESHHPAVRHASVGSLELRSRKERNDIPYCRHIFHSTHPHNGT